MTPPPKTGGRGGWLLATALFATMAIALSFVDAAGPRPSAVIETRPGFFAVFGLCASIALAMFARLVRIILGRTDRDDDSGHA